MSKQDRVACAGVSEESVSFDAGTVEQEWFFVRIRDDKTKIVSEYLEMQTIYANGAGTGHWRKQLRRGDSFAWASGDRSRPLSDLRKLTEKEQGSSLDHRNLQVLQYRYPDPFALTIFSASNYGLHIDWALVSHLFEKGELEDVDSTDDKILKCNATTERLFTRIDFEAKTGMPVKAVGYFRDKKSPQGVGKINFESKTKWEVIDERREIFAPISITNRAHNVNLKNTGSRLCEISCSYKVNDLSPNLLSDESLNSLLGGHGELVDLREELVKKAYKTAKRE
ncbi:hypothetical protein SH449x_002915 [Pirellulaceae bacterium SH449]